MTENLANRIDHDMLAHAEREASDFSDLDATDAELEAGSAPEPKKTFLEHSAEFASRRTREQAQCRACRGTGKFLSKFTGRVVGDCFRCKGTGKADAAGQKAVESRKANAPKREQEKLGRIAAFTAEHKDMLVYLGARAQTWEFAGSLLRQFAERGSLSENQIAAVYNVMAADEERAKARAAKLTQAEPEGSGLDLSNLPAGRYAVPGGDTRLKVLIQRPKAPSKWAGWIFVSDAAEYGQGRKYGRQAPGKTYTGAIRAELEKIIADPKAACAAYGKLTGTCGVCGAHLEDEASVARGIGPICAGKF
jgi:hypothetical protein